jgi:beta-lactamase superfamily II metal-dependent hydrolase
MLAIHVLNVGHGDSAVVELRDNGNTSYGVIDSNRHGGGPVPLRKLRELGANELSFVCLTHPHKDHYTGLFELLRAFEGRTHHFYSFPFGELINNPARLRTLAQKYRALRDGQDDPEVTRGINEFLQIIKFATERFTPDNWIECAGEDLRIAPPGFANLIIKTILPPRKAKGDYFQRIASPEVAIAENPKDNDLSIALQIDYLGHKVILGGDGTLNNWINHRRWQERAHAPIQTRVVKLPHHGSHIDCDPVVLRNLFETTGERAAVISANGRSHPDEEVLDWLEADGVSPYCTNLVPQCGAKVTRLLPLPGLDPLLARWLQEVSEAGAQVQPCQGDVRILIDDDGRISVTPQFAHPCGYRGDYGALFGLPD